MRRPIFYCPELSMSFDFRFFLNAALFGVGLAMDAFSVSLANGLNEPEMKMLRQVLIAGTFGLFQIAMPLIGWLCVRAAASALKLFEKLVPWIALALLLWIGGKMLLEGIKYRDTAREGEPVGMGALLMQGVATSIDALSVGFTIAGYDFLSALVEALIIGMVTFLICLTGLKIGRTVGTRLSGRASILGGAILIAIGIEIFLKGIL